MVLTATVGALGLAGNKDVCFAAIAFQVDRWHVRIGSRLMMMSKNLVIANVAPWTCNAGVAHHNWCWYGIPAPSAVVTCDTWQLTCRSDVVEMSIVEMATNVALGRPNNIGQSVAAPDSVARSEFVKFDPCERIESTWMC